MGSLLQRAHEIRKRLLSVGDSEEFQGVPEEERLIILEQIDSVLESNRIDIDEKKLSFTPQSSGALLPVLINLIALVVLAGGVFLFLFFFNQNEATITQERVTAETAEGRLIRALKEESERQLSEKEQEIASIQSQLAGAEQERERLQAETDAEIARRESELRASLEAELEAERQRLQEQGFSEEDIENQLAQFELEKQNEFDAQLEAFTSQMEAEQAAREAEVAAQIAAIQGSLSQARADREQLEQELAAQAEELEQELRAQQAELEGERAEVLARLEEIGRQQEQEQLVVEQILLLYGRTNGQLKDSRYDEALITLDNLETYLAQPKVAQLPAIQRRQEIESFIIESMRRLILNEQALSEQTQDDQAANTLLASVAALVEEGNQAFTEGDLDGARNLYLRAIAQIPELEGGYERLKDIDNLAFEEEKQVLERERAEALAQLEDLGRQREQERLVLQQIFQLYDRINGHLKLNRYGEALQSLESLKTYLEQPNVAQLPAIQRRQTIESFIIESMNRLILNAMAQPNQMQGSQETENLLASVTMLVEEGNREFTRGNLETAQEKYLQAIAQLPDVERGYNRLKAIENLAIKEEQQALAGLLQAGDHSYRREDWTGSIEKYREALTYLRNGNFDADTMISQIMEAGYQLGTEDEVILTQEQRALLDKSRQLEAERQLLLRQLSDIESRYAAVSSGPSGASSQETLVALLNTKLLIKQVLASESIRAEHPDLYREIDRIFEAYGEEKRKEGQKAAVRDLVAVTRYLSEAPDSTAPLSEPLQQLSGQGDLLVQFFSNLKKLLSLE